MTKETIFINATIDRVYSPLGKEARLKIQQVLSDQFHTKERVNIIMGDDLEDIKRIRRHTNDIVEEVAKEVTISRS